MPDIDLKTLSPDSTINDSAVLFGADSQASASPSVYAVSTVRQHIVGTANTFTQPQIISANSSSDALRITQTGAGNALLVEDSANPDSTPFVVTTLGRVGVGTSSPISLLQSTVSDGAFGFFVTGATRAVRFVPSSTAMSIEGIDNTGSASFQPLIIGGSDLRFATNNNERMRITSTGNVGIGPAVTNPTTQLQIEGAPVNITLRDTRAASNGFFQVGARGGSGELAILDVDPNNVIANSIFAINMDGIERLRIVSGNVCIGTTTFGTSAEEVLSIGTGVAPTTGAADTIQIYSTDLSAGNTMLSIYTEGTSVNANTTAAATHRIAVRINGTVYYLLANTAA
jgi:hypothetical protein